MSAFAWTMPLDHRRNGLMSDIAYTIVLNPLTNTLYLKVHAS